MDKQAFKTHKWEEIDFKDFLWWKKSLYACATCFVRYESKCKGAFWRADLLHDNHNRWNGKTTCKQEVESLKRKFPTPNLETEDLLKESIVLDEQYVRLFALAEEANLQAGFYWVQLKPEIHFRRYNKATQILMAHYDGSDKDYPMDPNWTLIHVADSACFDDIEKYQLIPQPENL